MSNSPDIDAALLSGLDAGGRATRFAACRSASNARLAAGDFDGAAVDAHRALELWAGEPGFIEAYIQHMRGRKDSVAIKNASKKAGMWHAARREHIKALTYFNAHQYADQSIGGGDKYAYDGDILEAIERLAGVEAGGALPLRRVSHKQRYKIAYLVYGANHSGSALISVLREFARHHDGDRLDVRYFAPDIKVPARDINVASLREDGVELTVVDSSDDTICMFETELAMRSFQPDLLVSVAVLADYRQYYLFAACPAAARVCLCYGPPQQFVSPKANWVISSNRHILMDSPCDGSIVDIEVDLPARPQTLSPLPAEVSIPEACPLVVSGGRSEKFIDPAYWVAVLTVLRANPTTRFIAFGISSPPEFLDDLLSQHADVRERVFLLGWLGEYRSLIARADVFLDTFPSGGGLVILDAMAFGVPVLSFSGDYLKPFDQMRWNLGEELLGLPELVVPRSDMSELVIRLNRLIRDPAYRSRMGEYCWSRATSHRGEPQRMVRRVEEVYLSLLSRAGRENSPPSAQGEEFASPEQLARLQLIYMQRSHLDQISDLNEALLQAEAKIQKFRKIYKWLPEPLKKVGKKVLKRIF